MLSEISIIILYFSVCTGYNSSAKSTYFDINTKKDILMLGKLSMCENNFQLRLESWVTTSVLLGDCQKKSIVCAKILRVSYV